MKSKCAGFLYEANMIYLDHIATFCSLFSFPLICTDKGIAQLATDLYPDLLVDLRIEQDWSKIVVKKYNCIFTCLPYLFCDPLFFVERHVQRKRFFSIWVPHGNSDKKNLNGLVGDKIALLYGNQMLDRLKKIGLLKKLYGSKIVGNFRSYFFQKNESFYREKLMPLLTFRDTKRKTIFYAPTWCDYGIQNHLPKIIAMLSQRYNLLIKLHPNTLMQSFYLHLEEKNSNNPYVKFIHDIPTIFPILSVVDILITGFSSIAYDFLFFQKPIFFLTRKHGPICHCGYRSSIKTLLSDLEKPDIFSDARSDLYRYAFSHEVDYSQMRRELLEICHRFLQGEALFL